MISDALWREAIEAAVAHFSPRLGSLVGEGAEAGGAR